MVAENIKRVRDIVNPSRLPDYDYVINPYVGCTHKCMYCYAEFMKRFSKHEEEWGDFVDAKLSSRPINLIRLDGANVLMSSVTDPYTPCEKKHENTRSILNQLKDANIKLTLVTKSDLILRDLDILKQFKNLEVAFSISTLNEKFKKEIEPNSPSVKKRLDALQKLHEAGIRTIVYVSPIFPELTNFKEIVEATKDFADFYWFENLNLRGTFRPKIMSYINEKHSQFNDLYKDIYKFHISDYWVEKEKEIEDYCNENNISFKNCFYHERNRKR